MLGNYILYYFFEDIRFYAMCLIIQLVIAYFIDERQKKYLLIIVIYILLDWARGLIFITTSNDIYTFHFHPFEIYLAKMLQISIVLFVILGSGLIANMFFNKIKK